MLKCTKLRTSKFLKIVDIFPTTLLYNFNSGNYDWFIFSNAKASMIPLDLY